jgi:hypothetical protein
LNSEFPRGIDLEGAIDSHPNTSIIDTKNNEYQIDLKEQSLIDNKHIASFSEHNPSIHHNYDHRLISMIKLKKSYLSIGSGQCTVLNRIKQEIDEFIGVKCFTSKGTTEIKIFKIGTGIDPDQYSLAANQSFVIDDKDHSHVYLITPKGSLYGLFISQTQNDLEIKYKQYHPLNKSKEFNPFKVKDLYFTHADYFNPLCELR